MEKNRVLPVSHALVFLLIHLGTGLAAPVLSLMLLARGATLATLPFVVGVTTVVTCLLEVPSGIAADVLGRRRVFALSMALQVATYVVLLATPSLGVVAVSSVLRGLALAARTGTLEAVELDRVVTEHADAAGRLAALDALNGRLALLESAGVGAGAIAGGVLATLDPSYVLLIACIIASGVAALAGGLVLFPPDMRSSVPVRDRLRATLADMRATLARPGDIRSLPSRGWWARAARGCWASSTARAWARLRSAARRRCAGGARRPGHTGGTGSTWRCRRRRSSAWRSSRPRRACPCSWSST